MMMMMTTTTMTICLTMSFRFVAKIIIIQSKKTFMTILVGKFILATFEIKGK